MSLSIASHREARSSWKDGYLADPMSNPTIPGARQPWGKGKKYCVKERALATPMLAQIQTASAAEALGLVEQAHTSACPGSSSKRIPRAGPAALGLSEQALPWGNENSVDKRWKENAELGLFCDFHFDGVLLPESEAEQLKG